MKRRIHNHVSEMRKARGIPAAELARRVGVSRQTIYAIEAGTFVPNTEVALLMARELEVRVDELFSLERTTAAAEEAIETEVLSAGPVFPGQRIRLARVGSRWIAAEATAFPRCIPAADGAIAHLAKGKAAVAAFARYEPGSRLVLAGCDPASSLVARMAEKAGVDVVCAAGSSSLVLRWLQEGKVHLAGTHLEDPKTGEFNLPLLRKKFAGTALTVVTFARWEEGFVVGAGNPKALRKVDDLANARLRFVNRESGSGSRALLDSMLAQAGLTGRAIGGYEDIAYGHLAAAYRVASGDADACLATRSAALAFGLGFVPMHTERYDLVMRRETADLAAVKTFLDVLQTAALRREVESLAGYDTAEMGAVKSL